MTKATTIKSPFSVEAGRIVFQKGLLLKLSQVMRHRYALELRPVMVHILKARVYDR